MESSLRKESRAPTYICNSFWGFVNVVIFFSFSHFEGFHADLNVVVFVPLDIFSVGFMSDVIS